MIGLLSRGSPQECLKELPRKSFRHSFFSRGDTCFYHLTLEISNEDDFLEFAYACNDKIHSSSIRYFIAVGNEIYMKMLDRQLYITMDFVKTCLFCLDIAKKLLLNHPLSVG